MSKDLDERIVAAPMKAGRALTLREIYNALEDLVEHEDELARHLRRLVDTAKLARLTRKRFGARDEFEYDTPGRARLGLIAGAAKAHATDDAAAAAVADTRPEPIPEEPTTPKEPNMVKKKTRRKPAEIQAAVAAALQTFTEPTKISAIAEAAGIAIGPTLRALNALLAASKAERTGKARGTMWAPAGTGEAKVAEGNRKRNLAEFGASPPAAPAASAPAPNGAGPEDVAFAIESTGTVAISEVKGKEKVRMKPKDVRALAAFLDLTKPLWHGAGA